MLCTLCEQHWVVELGMLTQSPDPGHGKRKPLLLRLSPTPPVFLQPHLHSYKEAFEELEGSSPTSTPPSGGKSTYSAWHFPPSPIPHPFPSLISILTCVEMGWEACVDEGGRLLCSMCQLMPSSSQLLPQCSLSAPGPGSHHCECGSPGLTMQAC